MAVFCTLRKPKITRKKQSLQPRSGTPPGPGEASDLSTRDRRARPDAVGHRRRDGGHHGDEQDLRPGSSWPAGPGPGPRPSGLGDVISVLRLPGVVAPLAFEGANDTPTFEGYGTRVVTKPRRGGHRKTSTSIPTRMTGVSGRANRCLLDIPAKPFVETDGGSPSEETPGLGVVAQEVIHLGNPGGVVDDAARAPREGLDAFGRVADRVACAGPKVYSLPGRPGVRTHEQ